MHQIPSLPYKYGDLEPFIDEETMRLHHLKHHQSYVDKLNAALESYPDLAQEPVEKLLADLITVPEPIRSAVRNHGGGHLNHSLFWPMLAPNKNKTEPTPRERTIGLLDETFGGYNGFKQQFKETALTRFGSGWAWLILEEGNRPAIISTANQDTPLSENKKILLGLDVWEHAYYLKYQNRRADYIEAFFHLINWDYVERALD